MDNIASFFYLDMIPSGSEDPFALRRQAAGIINILQSNAYTVSINSLIASSLKSLETSEENRAKLTDRVLQFFTQRLEGMLLSQGHSYDIINAVLSVSELNFTDINLRIKSLSAMKKEPAFPALLTAAKRVYNILGKIQPHDVNESLLSEPSEKDLFSAVEKIKNKLTTGDFMVLYKLEGPINLFFNSVLVMDKNPQIKDNRLALLLSVKKSFDSLGDFSKIVE